MAWFQNWHISKIWYTLFIIPVHPTITSNCERLFRGVIQFFKDFSWHDGAAISKTCLADACLEIRTNASKVYLVNCFLQIHKKAQKIMWHCQNMYPYIVVKAAIVKWKGCKQVNFLMSNQNYWTGPGQKNHKIISYTCPLCKTCRFKYFHFRAAAQLLYIVQSFTRSLTTSQHWCLKKFDCINIPLCV